MKWRKIETAPKDGTLILAFDALCAREGWALPVLWSKSGRWLNCARGIILIPTHWAPMPDSLPREIDHE